MDEKDWDDRSPGGGFSEDVLREESGQRNQPGDNEAIIDLVDLVHEEKAVLTPEQEAALRRQIAETAERIARELFPAIAERVIREEIEKLKSSK